MKQIYFYDLWRGETKIFFSFFETEDLPPFHVVQYNSPFQDPISGNLNAVALWKVKGSGNLKIVMNCVAEFVASLNKNE